MSKEKEVKKVILGDLRKNLGLVHKITSYLGYPIMIFNRLYIGPGNWVINDFDMSDEKTREYIYKNPDVIEKINLSVNEAFARISTYWSPLCTRRFDYTLINEKEEWRIKSKELSGMA